MKLPESLASTSPESSSGSTAVAVWQWELAVSWCFPKVACRAQAGTCAIHSLPGEWGMRGAPVTPDYDRAVPLPHSNSAAKAATSFPSLQVLVCLSHSQRQTKTSLVCIVVEVSSQYPDPWRCYSYKQLFLVAVFFLFVRVTLLL